VASLLSEVKRLDTYQTTKEADWRFIHYLIKQFKRKFFRCTNHSGNFICLVCVPYVTTNQTSPEQSSSFIGKAKAHKIFVLIRHSEQYSEIKRITSLRTNPDCCPYEPKFRSIGFQEFRKLFLLNSSYDYNDEGTLPYWYLNKHEIYNFTNSGLLLHQITKFCHPCFIRLLRFEIDHLKILINEVYQLFW